MPTDVTYQFDLTKDEVSYLMELLHNEVVSSNANATLASSLANTLHFGVVIDDHLRERGELPPQVSDDAPIVVDATEVVF